AGRMTMGVVDRLETVEVEHHHGWPAALGRGPQQRVIELFGKKTPVGQVGERIMARKLDGPPLGGSAPLPFMGKILEPPKAEDHQAQAKHERHQDGVIGSPVLIFLDEVYEFQKK